MAHALTNEQIAQLKDLLLARREELFSQMEQNRTNLAPAENVAGSVSQDESARLKNQTREVDTVLNNIDRHDLQRIDHALQNIKDGEYGRCEECDCHIPFERLKVEPMTAHCVKCKSEIEAHQH